MLDYDLESVGPKITKIKPSMESELEKFSDINPALLGQEVNKMMAIMNDELEKIPTIEEKIKHTKEKLFEYIQAGEITAALAIYDCFIGITGISGEALGLKDLSKLVENRTENSEESSFIGSIDEDVLDNLLGKIKIFFPD